jgi:hypothetical protein
MTDGGYSDRSVSGEINKANDMKRMLQDAVAELPNPVLQYEEFTKFEKAVSRSKNVAKLG